MKPRILKLEGLYLCELLGTRTGYGYDAAEAYWDWDRINKVSAC